MASAFISGIVLRLTANDQTRPTKLLATCPTASAMTCWPTRCSCSFRSALGCISNTERAHETTGEGTGDYAADDAQNQAEPAAEQGDDTLAMLVAALANLSAADRAKPAAMLLHV